MTQPDPRTYTLGVEEEYQLVDPGSGELVSMAAAVLASDWSGDIKPELQQHTLEVETRVCESADEIRSELSRLRTQAATVAEARGLRVVAAGTHPFSDWAGQRFTDAPVYRRLQDEYRRLARSQTIFGLHVHVGVPQGVDRARLVNTLRHYLPLLLALSGSSPFYLGEDTGYASYRTILWKRWPRSGAPPRFTDEGEYRSMIRLMMEAGRMDGPGRIYWSIRAHHEYPTVEFRVADVTPRMGDAVVIAALARALVAAVVAGGIEEPTLPEATVQTLLAENEWIAARDGVDAELVDYWSGAPAVRPVADVLLELRESLAGTCRMLGDAEALDRLADLVARGEGARRMRECVRSEQIGAGLVRWLADETLVGVGLDRRREQRDGC